MNLPVFSFIDDVKTELGSIGQKLIPNFYSFVVQLLALIVVILIVMFLLYKPVKKTLDARSDFIENEINSAKENNVISEQNLKNSEQTILESRNKANEIIASANALALAKKDEVIKETNEMVTKMKLDAEEEIKLAKLEAKQEIHNEIVNVALDASKEILSREISKEDDMRLVDDFLKDID